VWTNQPSTIDDILAIAAAMEREAADRYALLADCMRKVGQESVACLFDELAAEERGHVDHVDSMAQKMLNRQPASNVAAPGLPVTFGRSDEVGAAALLSPYRALSIAVRNEERAFSFWTYIAAQGGQDELRSLAETFARQELIHAARLRRARRQAFHAERGQRPASGRDWESSTPADIRAEAALLEDAFAAFCTAAAAALRAADPGDAAMFDGLAEEARRSIAAFGAGGGLLLAAGRQAQVMRVERHCGRSAALLFDLAGMTEDLDDRYLDWLDRTGDQAFRRELEARAAATTARLARINERLLALEPSLAGLGGA
jgi:rubrerythrin